MGCAAGCVAGAAGRGAGAQGTPGGQGRGQGREVEPQGGPEVHTAFALTCGGAELG